MPQANDHDTPPAFRLERASVKRPKPATFTSQEATQLKLFRGLDCLPGQLDLFNADKTTVPSNDDSHGAASRRT